jgi:hypothetical protein
MASCAQISSSLKAVFGEKNELKNLDWVRNNFNKIVEVIAPLVTEAIAKRTGEEKELIPVEVCDVVEYQISPAKSEKNISYVFIQIFEGASLTLRTDSDSNSFILVFDRFTEIDCGILNGKINKLFPGVAVSQWADQFNY